MLGWLQSYWGAVVALVALASALWGLAEKLEKKIEQHAPLRAWIVRWLVVPNFHDRYRDWLGRRLAELQGWMGGRWSGQAFARCLAIAYAYPIVLMLLGYAAGGPGTIGGTEFLPNLGDWRQPMLGLVVFVGGLVSVGVRAGAAAFAVVGAGAGAVVFALVGVEAFTGAVAFAITLAVVVFMAGAFAGTLAGTGVFTGAFSGAAAVAVAGAFAGAGAGAGALAEAAARVPAEAGGPSLTRVVFTGALALVGPGALAGYAAVCVVMAGTFAGGIARAFTRAGTGAGAVVSAGAVAVVVALMLLWITGLGLGTVTWLLFVVALPFANALLDWPSWAISRWLGHDLHGLLKGEVGRFWRLLQGLLKGLFQPVTFVLHAAIDLFVALLLLVVLAALLPFLIQLFNAAVIHAGGKAPLPLAGFLDAAMVDPWPMGFWALAMLLTTLVPTAIHAGAVLVTLFLWLVQPAAWRQRIERGLQTRERDERAWAIAKASWLVILTPLVAALVVVALGWVFTRLIGLVEPVAGLLFYAAQFGMSQADHLAGALGWLAPRNGPF